ncbi:A24 family peptidase [Erwinia sp. Leaf53]|uniref:prepilin peptidase n=1 Tax=Erwinia sp. Leaf53 TaxID=1736225 RepID=UPI0006FBB856|nr:A24 family peptidase [Erwinia sp. Leaf53]KQN58117.1 prepilin peptidase [Erwinia sp. Leaf53]
MNEIFLPIALLGACAGSLMNMVVWRLPRMVLQQEGPEFSLWLPASHCPRCRVALAWYDNLPLLSWLWLRGRSRCCGQQIGLRYLLIELACVLLSLLMAWVFPADGRLAAALLLGWFLLALSLIDRDHQMLPDALTLPLLWLGIVCQLAGWLPDITLEQSVTGAMAGYLSLWLLATSYRLLRGKEALGMGDAKLLAALGAWLGWQPLPLLLLLASASGIVWLACSHLLSRRSFNAPLPFGPCLAAAGGLLFIAENSDLLPFSL